jgi:uncharacterized repeat protein (TIGR03803 family)/T5SS/PEP-CTERM-associated repeat protein
MAMSFLLLGHIVAAQTSWTEVTPAAPWSTRQLFGLVVFNGQMWVMGGDNAGNYLNDVWFSSNGLNWTEVTPAAPWGDRRGFGSVVFNGQMWVLGGYGNGGVLNDVWSTSDGTNWTEVTSAAPWSNREFFGAIVFNGQMWVMGGCCYDNDVWSSSDGTNWTQVTAAALWSAREQFGAVVFNNLTWVLGGYGNGGVLNDVWSSSDGANWTQVTPATPWSTRQLFGSVVFNGQMWVMGGDNGSYYLNDVWSSSDGTNWTQVTPAAPWSARHGLGSVVFNGQMWVLGGDDGSMRNDVWVYSVNSWTDGSDKWENAADWSLGVAPSLSDSADYVTNANTKTVTIDATTATDFHGTMTIYDLTIIGSIDSTNTLFLDNAGTVIPLQILGGALTLDTNGFMVVNNSVVVASDGSVRVGYSGAGSTLIVSNGGVVLNDDGYIGYGLGSASTDNTAIISGNGSTWINIYDLFVGLKGTGNSLIITNGGAVYSGYGYIGFDSNANNNTALVSGPGSVWGNGDDFTIGNAGTGNQLIITGGAQAYNNAGYVGYGSTSTGNSALVTGPGSFWNNESTLFVGSGGDNNSLTIANGGVVFSGDSTIGDNGEGSVEVTDPGSVWNIDGGLTVSEDGGGSLTVTNGGAVYCNGATVADMSPGTVLVTGSGSVWSNSGDLYVGQNGYPFGTITIANGGAVFDNNVYLGSFGNPSNIVSVGGTWQNQGNLYVGLESSGNQVSIGAGGSFVASNLYIGNINKGVVGGQITVSGGALYVTNGPGSGQLGVGGGTLTLNSGTVSAASLVVISNQHVSAFVSFNGGILSTEGTAVTNGVAFVVGDGTDAATFQLHGGVHSFANNLEASNNATLSGCGTIDGNVVVDPGGTVLADCGGTLTVRGNVTNNGSIIATNGTTIDLVGTVVGTGTVISTDGSVQFSVAINTSSSPPNGGSTSGTGVYGIGSKVTVCASANASCFSFANWTLNGNVVSTLACYTFTPTSNETLVANFNQFTYTIATSSSPAGAGSISGGGTVLCGTNVTVCATANSCYNFVNWSVNSSVVSTSACYTFLAASNETLTANFTPYVTITTTNTLTGAGSTSGGGTVLCGSRVTLCATPNPCYTFTSWGPLYGTAVSTSACYTFTATNTEIWTANFQSGFASLAITTTSSPPAGGSTSGGGNVPCGSNVTVCASPTPCYSFVNWTDPNGNVLSASACFTFPAANESPVDNHQTLVANFALVSAGIPNNGSLTNLWSFTNGEDGANPYAGLVQGNDGNFYGTTYDGGLNGYGTVFQISPGSNLTYLWSFSGGTDGANPGAWLAQGSDGNFYGTTSGNGFGPSGLGTVFRISPGGNLTNLWSFTGGTDGANPYAGLVLGSDGNFYGTTLGSGSGPSASGTVFRISPGGVLTNLWSFTGGADGANPWTGLVQGNDGNLYGTAYDGGANGYGTVFQISPRGVLTTLWSFTNGVDGANSYATLVQGVDGNFYGMTSGSGSGPSAYGSVFRISPSGSLTTLWSFVGCSDGAHPFAGLVQGSDGNFYGTTGLGFGPSAYGTVFRISPSGNLTTLWSYTNGVDGASSYAALVQGVDGNFYGTTSGSGSGPSLNGTVFELFVPLNPPANQITAIRLADRNLIVSIPSVAGETYQLQYCNSLTLSNWSNVGSTSMTNSIGGLLSLTNFGGASVPQGFYRFAITP